MHWDPIVGFCRNRRGAAAQVLESLRPRMNKSSYHTRRSHQKPLAPRRLKFTYPLDVQAPLMEPPPPRRCAATAGTPQTTSSSPRAHRRPVTNHCVIPPRPSLRASLAGIKPSLRHSIIPRGAASSTPSARASGPASTAILRPLSTRPQKPAHLLHPEEQPPFLDARNIVDHAPRWPAAQRKLRACAPPSPRRSYVSAQICSPLNPSDRCISTPAG